MTKTPFIITTALLAACGGALTGEETGELEDADLSEFESENAPLVLSSNGCNLIAYAPQYNAQQTLLWGKSWPACTYGGPMHFDVGLVHSDNPNVSGSCGDFTPNYHEYGYTQKAGYQGPYQY